ncbi:MAG: hypothetical protein ACLTAY_15520 [Thomasclavelia ramosa]
MELKTFEKKINKLDKKKIVDGYYKELKNIVDLMQPEERQKKYDRIAEILFKLLSLTDSKNFNNEMKDILIELCEMIAISNVNCVKGSYAFFVFLYSLKESSNVKISIEKNLEQYLLFGDIIEQVSWIFSLRKDDKIIFPIYELLSQLATNFECNNDSLVQLAIALQLFTMANEVIKSETSDKTREMITAIAVKYKIKFLQYLLDGGKMYSNNYLENGTLIFEYKNIFLIRNISDMYFNFDPRCKSEIDEQKNPIAYYVELKKPNNYKLVDFTDIMQRENDFDLKLSVLDQIFSENNYNILYDKLLYVNNQESKFLGFLNPFGKNDKKIIYKNDKVNNDISGFLSMLKYKVKNIRGSILFKDKIDILTMDFIMTLFEFIPNNNLNLNFYSISKLKRNDFFQNFIIKECFKQIKNKSLNEYFEMIVKYSEYIDRHLSKINLKTKMNENLVLILPYHMYFDFDSIEDFYCFEKQRIWDNEKSENIRWQEVKYIENPLPKIIDCETNKELQMVDFSGNNLDCSEISNNVECFVDKDKGLAFYDEDLFLQYRRIKNFIEWNNKSKLLYDDFKYIDENSFDDISRIIRLTKLKKINYDVFNSDIDNKMIPYYKLIWHFHLMQWGEQEVNIFFDLVLTKHYTKSLLNYKDCYSTLNRIESSITSGDTLYIAKENEHNQGTLYMLCNEYISEYGHKSRLTEMFQKESISKFCEINDIKKVVIVTDMLMNGKATIAALNFYLTGHRGNTKKEFIDIHAEISKLMKENQNIELELLALWGYKSSIEKIKKKINYPAFSIQIINEIPETFRSDSKLNDIIKNLYNHIVNREICCVFRFNNMPAHTLFPDYVTETDNIGGIFNRKEEFS